MEKESKNYYEVLELPMSATHEDIRSAYNRAKNAYTGDSIALYSLMTKEDCNKQLELVEEAYSILGHPPKRSEYDKVRGFNANSISGFNRPQSNFHLSPTSLREVSQAQESALNKSSTTDDEILKERENFGSMRTEMQISQLSAKSRFSLNYTKDPAREQEIENTAVFTGEVLRKIREYKAVSLERLAEMTRVSKTHLKNIEDENKEKLPANAYIRGFVFQYAKCLKLNPETVANSYMTYYKKTYNIK